MLSANILVLACTDAMGVLRFSGNNVRIFRKSGHSTVVIVGISIKEVYA